MYFKKYSILIDDTVIRLFFRDSINFSNVDYCSITAVNLFLRNSGLSFEGACKYQITISKNGAIK